MIHFVIKALELILLAVFVLGLSWILDDLLPHELRDWKDEPIEDGEETKGDRP